MIKEIGCNQDGGVWISIMMEVQNEWYTVICPMTNEKAVEVRGAMDTAIKQGAEWLKTGKQPGDILNVGKRKRHNKSNAKSDKRNRNG